MGRAMPPTMTAARLASQRRDGAGAAMAKAVSARTITKIAPPPAIMIQPIVLTTSAWGPAGSIADWTPEQPASKTAIGSASGAVPLGRGGGRDRRHLSLPPKRR